MQKILLLLTSLAFCWPGLNFSAHSALIQEKNDYIYTDQNIIKEFDQPIEFEKEKYSADGVANLFPPTNYNTKIALKLPVEDLKLIQKEILGVHLEFDYFLLWWGPKQGEKTLTVHLSQSLIYHDLTANLVCGVIEWKSKLFPGLKIKSLINFSWSQQELILEHQNNDFLTKNQMNNLIYIERNGLAKLHLKLNNFRLVYQIPPIFNLLSTTKINLTYWANLKAMKEIDEKIQQLIQESEVLQLFEFSKYFEEPILTLQQKETLLHLQTDFHFLLELKLNLKTKYREKIFDPLLRKGTLNLNCFQLVDLNELILDSEIKIRENEDPQVYFLNHNPNYSFFFTHYCQFQISTNQLIIEPKKEFLNLQGRLVLEIIYLPDPILKTDLQTLKLKTNLGTIVSDQISILTQFLTLNQTVLTITDSQYYQINVTEKNREAEIKATANNPEYVGHCQVFFETEEKTVPDNPVQEKNLDQKNFFQQYWWGFLILFCLLILVVWFGVRFYQSKKQKNSN